MLGGMPQKRAGERSERAGHDAPQGIGLCATCRHRRVVENTRGSVFHLCERSREDPSYPRYPRLPVLSCRGYEQAPR